MTSTEMQVDPGPQDGEYEPSGPRPIEKLSKDVINQIAAAEIIHRPSNAIKELIENSLDAGSTSIKLTIKDGGLKLIQIADNGHGISREDLPLLCTRYATSKLKAFEDLQSLRTYGFRGEALASVSYCSHVEVITKTKNDGCGWKAHYADGELVSPKPGVPPDPRPAAANDGTIISAEDLFYNMPLRKRAFKSASDEYNRILDVVQKYAVHNPHAAWVCKKAGSSLPDISTPAGSTSKANISLLYTASLAADLLEVPITVLQPQYLGASIRGWVSNANTNWARRGGWLFFINNRLVDSTKIKKAIDSLYTSYLPKGAAPWVYLSLDIDPAKVDVNVHPTKSDVHFLNEDEMVVAIVGAVQTALSNANTSRTFTVQTLLPGAPDPQDRGDSGSSVPRTKSAPNYKVRMDPTNRTLDSMIAVSDPSQLAAFTETPQTLLDPEHRPAKRRGINEDEPIELEEEDELDDGRETTWALTTGEGKKGNEIPESACEFSSILELRKATRKRGNIEMNEMIQGHSFVGIVDRDLCLSLVQHGTKLFLINHAVIGDELFYQLSLRQFGALHRLRLEPPPRLDDLLRLAANDEPGLVSAGLVVEDVVRRISNMLLEKREMMDEYFSLRISESGEVESLPMILKGYTPNLDRLPHLLLCLGTQGRVDKASKVNWTSEKECFQTVLRELAFFYSPRPSDVDSMATDAEKQHRDWQLEHVFFPACRRREVVWPRAREMGGSGVGREGVVQQVANLPDLFRIFERC
ncbi:putative DNA binding protein [Naematelia encephala]|uniref:Putative DNA binding protein n=1 Tax=Naematelia encephala TaxID=71784 RepID=A0A1Y2BKU3_9TREE|nr:putative DNA binding protein [Naematelia encephala]